MTPRLANPPPPPLGIAHLIRGFSTNVANYRPLGVGSVCPEAAFSDTGTIKYGWPAGLGSYCAADERPNDEETSRCCADDPCGVITQGNGGPTELSYAQTLQRHFISKINWTPHFIIDSGRNGNSKPVDCDAWCNVRDAGAGHVPTLNTGLPHVVDAFFWLKTPGESDGCSEILPDGSECPRFDESCGKPNALGSRADTEPAAPEAGEWYEYQIKMLARNSDLRRSAPGALDATW